MFVSNTDQPKVLF